jgi:hypothetical protein
MKLDAFRPLISHFKSPIHRQFRAALSIWYRSGRRSAHIVSEPARPSRSGRHEMEDDTKDAQKLHERALFLWRAKGELDQQSERAAAACRAVAFRLPVAWDGAINLALKWARSLAEYEEFCRTSPQNRAPRENTRNRESLPKQERNLAQWARYQRRFNLHLSAFQIERLKISPAFHWDPVESTWKVRLQQCRIFFEEASRLPILNSADPREYQLARWLNHQLHHLRAGSLSPARATMLDSFFRHLPDAHAVTEHTD